MIMVERPGNNPQIRNSGYLIVVIALVTAFFSLSTPAHSQDLYAVSGILVDETAANEVEAKQIGIRQAKRQAFQTLIDRLTLPPGTVSTEYTDPSSTGGQTGLNSPNTSPDASPAPLSHPPIAVPDDDRLEFMLRDVSFQDERFGGGRYLATMTIRFQSAAVNQFLQRNGAAYLAEPSRRTVILPIYRDAGGDQLWSEFNPWLEAWGGLDGGGLIVPFTVPLGDLADITAIDVDRALAIDGPSINAIAARYGAGAVVIVLAAHSADGGILVEISSYGTGWPPAPELLVIGRDDILAGLPPDEASGDATAAAPTAAPTTDDAAGDPLAAYPPVQVLEVAARKTVTALETRWKRANILRFDQQAATLNAHVTLTGIQDWLLIQQALNAAAPIKTWRLSLLAVDHAEVEIDHIGDTTRLNQALSRAAVQLSPNPTGDGWVLSRR